MDICKSVFPFVCDNPACKKEYDIREFSDVLLLWGIIYLTDNRHDLIEYTLKYDGITIRTMDTAIPQFLQPVLNILNKIVDECE